MAIQNKKTVSATVPLGRVFHLNELPGWVGKYMEVPPGRLGMAIQPDGTVHTFPVGRHQLLTNWGRLQGRGSRLLVGYVPVEVSMAQVKLGYLLSGDQELLSGRVICAVEVGDAARFLREVVAPQGTVWSGGMELDPQPIEDALAPILTQYAAADIIHGQVDARIAGVVQTGLQATLELKGLRLQQILLVGLTRAEDRAVIAEKAQALSERLQDVSLQAKMAEIDNQSQLDDFLHQLDPELDQMAHLKLGGEGSEKGKASFKGKVVDAIRSWLTIEASKEGGKRRWSIEGLFQRKGGDDEKGRQKPRHVSSNWWVSRALWMTLVILLGCGLTGIVNWIAQTASWDNKIEILLGIWGFVIIVVLESVKALYEKREALSEESWIYPGFQHLDNLVGNNRQRVDQLVREQCAHELQHIREVISEIRTREYNRGKTELALKLRNELERNLEECAAKVQRADYGHPPYVTDLRISNNAWSHMLDVDEDLLLEVNALSDQAHLLQQKSYEDQLENSMIVALDAKVSKFCNKFHDRGHPLQMTPEKS